MIGAIKKVIRTAFIPKNAPTIAIYLRSPPPREHLNGSIKKPAMPAVNNRIHPKKHANIASVNPRLFGNKVFKRTPTIDPGMVK